MTTREQDVRLADSRVLRVLDTGPADGHAVLVCHGTPASRRLHDGWVTAAAAGLRLISYDRPGYGSSSPQPGRTIADTASDVAAIADDLASTGSPCGDPQPVARTPWPARPCLSTAWSPLQWLRPMRRTTHPGWTSSPACRRGAPNCSSWRPPAGMRCSRCCRRRPKRSERVRRLPGAGHLLERGPGRGAGAGLALVRRAGPVDAGRSRPLARRCHPRRPAAAVAWRGPLLASLRTPPGDPRLAR
jgi:hypothetical protein